MSILGRLVVLVLISLLVLAPGLASAAAPSEPPCGMAGMAQEAGATTKALSAICKLQCHAPATIPQPGIVAEGIAWKTIVPPEAPTLPPSRATPPEAPPPRS